MKKITITASSTYDVFVDTGLLQNIGEYIAPIVLSGTVVIISDSNVWPLYGNEVCNALLNSNICFLHYVIPAGEGSKTATTYLNILDFLAENSITRTDSIIALGGGVVGDLAGFVAATYQRGLKYIQIPTSLLAMVDSSVGGKTAIDLPAGKNLVGAFKQPSIVLCDLSTLDTLPSDIFIDGCAEIIKYGILYDPELFEYIRDTGILFNREYVISKCIALKACVVHDDEFDTGLRQKLNLGHTIAHAIESLSNYTISHGKAVAAGIAIIARASAANEICTKEERELILNTLSKFSLPTKTNYTSSEISVAALSDKKRSAKTLNLIVPKGIGNCEILPYSIDKLQSFIEAGL